MTAEQPAIAKPSPLAEQNRLLQAAQLARRNGMPALALERLETLIERYPGSELTHNALVERFRLLASMGETAKARNAANEYLKRYPAGFARAEAERLGGPAQ
jgi:outer membrane protein assembly factor BamD (BamD/ComL family)